MKTMTMHLYHQHTHHEDHEDRIQEYAITDVLAIHEVNHFRYDLKRIYHGLIASYQPSTQYTSLLELRLNKATIEPSDTQQETINQSQFTSNEIRNLFTHHHSMPYTLLLQKLSHLPRTTNHGNMEKGLRKLATLLGASHTSLHLESKNSLIIEISYKDTHQSGHVLLEIMEHTEKPLENYHNRYTKPRP